MNCPNCSSALPEAARFCMYCGQPVAAPSQADDARLSRVTASVPAPLAEKMYAAKLSGERKVVTALFADVVGSTSMAEQMDPEDWTEMMNGAFDRISPAIYHYEGTVARLLGDAMLAFFGAPVAHEDDPARAVYAALEILDAIREYAIHAKRKYGMNFAIRIGINTGSVVVGDVGSELKYEYTAMGDAINLAARLQTAAKPMTILISQNTQRSIAPIFDFADLGQLEVKGRIEPVQTYEVIGVQSAPGRVRGLAGLTSPMVGRDQELEALITQGQGLRHKQGGIAVIIGEAGLGKSRLFSEWRNASNSDPAICWAHGHCLSYGQRLAYHLVIDLLRSLLGARQAATDAQIQRALKGMVNDLFPDSAAEVYPYLGHLLSLDLDAESLKLVQSLDPQLLQNHYREALSRLLEVLSTRQPVILVLDDIHWADPASVELLTHLLPLTVKSAILVCMLTRPDEETPGWRLVAEARKSFSDHLIELMLSPLAPQDSRQLVSNLLEIEALPEQVRDKILSKADGNPFFVEEVIRMLIDTGGIIPKDNHWEAGKAIDFVEIPDNLQSLLLARIDRLPEESKRTLRVAAVIGRQFSVNVLEQVMRSLDE